MKQAKYRFNQQHGIITGGSSGIGKAVAKLLVQQGANVTIIARNQERLNLAQEELISFKVNPQQNILALKADVSRQEEITSALETAIAHLGTPDMLITSAGIAIPGYFPEIPLEVFNQTMAVNYFGTLYAIRAVLPAMETAGKGHMVLIASGAGLIGLYGYSAYSPSKFALRGLAESLRGEFKPKGIKVSLVYPPDTDTPQLVAENKTKPLPTKAITATAKTWSPEGVAREIIQGIITNKFAIAPGLEMTILDRLHSVLRPLLNWYFDQIVQKFNNNQ
ncbi:MAG: SDR family oxidoreductase [Xenococcaceae cyanobacterium MO_207.B15]|nr:SDR family oxidoreductase [Xenococcaceae cyanobacterium MO_207.B15]